MIVMMFKTNARIATSTLAIPLVGFVVFERCCNLGLLAQIAAVGGNQRGRTFFKQHGWTELGSDKIEQKVIVDLHRVTCSVCWGQI